MLAKLPKLDRPHEQHLFRGDHLPSTLQQLQVQDILYPPIREYIEHSGVATKCTVRHANAPTVS